MAQSRPITEGSMLLNYSPDLYAQYGLCLTGGSGSANRLGPIIWVGESLANVLAVTILKCQPFSGGAPVKVACPAGSPYAYCINQGNDGQGNNVTFGVMKLTAETNPLARYSGCPAGAAGGSKLRLVELAGMEPREVKAIVTLSCGPATAAAFAKPASVPCPKGPDPYRGYCLGTPNDGRGNAVTIGVVRANGAGDPYGLYGNCNDPVNRPGITKGFLMKSSLVIAAGRQIEMVRNIDMIGCSVAYNFPPSLPSDRIEEVPCSVMFSYDVRGQIAHRYDYCVWGTDAKGNGVLAGVNGDN